MLALMHEVHPSFKRTCYNCHYVHTHARSAVCKSLFDNKESVAILQLQVKVFQYESWVLLKVTNVVNWLQYYEEHKQSCYSAGSIPKLA